MIQLHPWYNSTGVSEVMHGWYLAQETYGSIPHKPPHKRLQLKNILATLIRCKEEDLIRCLGKFEAQKFLNEDLCLMNKARGLFLLVCFHSNLIFLGWSMELILLHNTSCQVCDVLLVASHLPLEINAKRQKNEYIYLQAIYINIPVYRIMHLHFWYIHIQNLISSSR